MPPPPAGCAAQTSLRPRLPCFRRKERAGERSWDRACVVGEGAGCEVWGARKRAVVPQNRRLSVNLGRKKVVFLRKSNGEEAFAADAAAGTLARTNAPKLYPSCQGGAEEVPRNQIVSIWKKFIHLV